jgi:hypothetical protein
MTHERMSPLRERMLEDNNPNLRLSINEGYKGRNIVNVRDPAPSCTRRRITLCGLSICLFGAFAENRNHLPHGLHLPRPQPVPIVRMRWAGRRAASSIMNAADCPAFLGGAFTLLPGALGFGCASIVTG